jgi:hypothetical protein
MVYRVKQFIWAVTARLTKDDISFINSYLDNYERKLFFSLSLSIQVHSVKVARDVLSECLKRNIDDIFLIKAGLLHDIGQANRGLNIITKSIVVILNRLFPRWTKRLSGIGFINAYLNHPEIALDYLDMEDEYIKYLIRNHHNYNVEADEKLRILQLADSRN